MASGSGARPPRTSKTRPDRLVRTLREIRPAERRAASMSSFKSFEVLGKDTAVIANQFREARGRALKAQLACELRVHLNLLIGRTTSGRAGFSSSSVALARAAPSTCSAMRKRRAAITVMATASASHSSASATIATVVAPRALMNAAR